MAVSDNELFIAIIAGIGVGVLLYCAQQQTGEAGPVPEFQGEAQVMGLGVQAGMRMNYGTNLDMSHSIHGYHPGYDPDPSAQPVMDSPHRYPSVPGGNVSTVIHNGWSRMSKAAPAGNDWYNNPPEAAVL